MYNPTYNYIVGAHLVYIHIYKIIQMTLKIIWVFPGMKTSPLSLQGGPIAHMEESNWTPRGPAHRKIPKVAERQSSPWNHVSKVAIWIIIGQILRGKRFKFVSGTQSFLYKKMVNAEDKLLLNVFLCPKFAWSKSLPEKNNKNDLSETIALLSYYEGSKCSAFRCLKLQGGVKIP